MTEGDDMAVGQHHYIDSPNDDAQSSATTPHVEIPLDNSCKILVFNEASPNYTEDSSNYSALIRLHLLGILG